MKYKKVIAFLLWGGKPLYTTGAIRQVEVAKDVFPGWVCRFYVPMAKNEIHVPMKIIDKLKSFDNVEIVKKEFYRWADGQYAQGTHGAIKNPAGSIFWKIQTYFDPDVEVFLSRDTDDRMTKREKIAIDEWLESDYPFHIMRDHPGHCTGTPILGSMWGMKTSFKFDLQKLIDEYLIQTKWPMIDQWFLMKYIYPLVKDCSMIHHDKSCAAGCQVPMDDPLHWIDGPNSEHRMFVPRKGTNVIGKDYLECIGISVGEDDISNEENQGKLKKWIESGVYWWKK